MNSRLSESELRAVRASHKKRRHGQRPGARRVYLVCAHCGRRLNPIYEFQGKVYMPIGEELDWIDGEFMSEGPAHFALFNYQAGKYDEDAHDGHPVEAASAASYRWTFRCKHRACPHHEADIVVRRSTVADAVLQALAEGRERVSLPL